MSALLRFQLLLVFSPAILLGIHVLANRAAIFFKVPLSSQIVALLSVGMGYGVICFFSWEIYLKCLTRVELWSGVVYMLLVYAGFSYSYFHIFNMSETARRIKILSDLLIAESLDQPAVKPQLAATEQISLRLERLLALGQVRKSGDRYFLRNRCLWFAAVILMWFRRVLKL
ncbi:MAG: hypothetical protein WC133_01655 [Candidatus Omnitrophota bacterium]